MMEDRLILSTTLPVEVLSKENTPEEKIGMAVATAVVSFLKDLQKVIGLISYLCMIRLYGIRYLIGRIVAAMQWILEKTDYVFFEDPTPLLIVLGVLTAMGLAYWLTIFLEAILIWF